MYCWSIDYFTDYFSRYLQKSIYFGARLIYDLSWWRPLLIIQMLQSQLIQSPWKCGSWNAPLPKIPRPLARPSVGPFQTLVPQLPTLRTLSDILLYWSTLIGKSLHTLENLAGEALTNLRLSNRCFGIQPTRRVCEKEMRKMVRRQISHFSKPLLNFENAESANSFFWFLRNLQMFDTWMWQIWKNKMIPGSSPTELNPSIAPKQNDANLTPKTNQQTIGIWAW